MNRPSNEHGYAEHKFKRELTQRERENFDAHQADTRNRVDTLAKLVFAISGGALTVSLGVFLREGAPILSFAQKNLLHVAWGCLFAAMAGFALLLVNLIVQASLVAAYWRPRLDGEEGRPGLAKAAKWSVAASWGIGILAFFAFLIGLGSLASLAVWLVR